MTPLEKYASDPRPIRRAGVAAFWEFALPTGRDSYIADPRGLNIDHRWRSGEGLKIDSHYAVRVLPGMDPIYLAGTLAGEFLTQLTSGDSDETEDERNTRLGKNHAKVAYLARITHMAQDNVQAAVDAPGTEAYLTPHQERKVAAASAPKLASVDAARHIPAPKDTAA